MHCNERVFNFGTGKEANQVTRLTYRGVEYETHNTEIDVIPTQTAGKYRGQYWRKNTVRMMPIDTRDVDLKYRGVKYHLGTETEPLTQFIKLADRCAISGNGQKPENIHCIHLRNIRRNIEYRLAIAKLKGDDALVRMLQDEARQLV